MISKFLLLFWVINLMTQYPLKRHVRFARQSLLPNLFYCTDGSQYEINQRVQKYKPTCMRHCGYQVQTAYYSLNKTNVCI